MTERVEEYLDDLLWHIEEGHVIPIVGQELLTVDVDGRQMLLYRYLAERLAEQLGVPAPDSPDDFTLNHVVCRYAQARGRIAGIYRLIRQIMGERTFAPSESLREFARIRKFKLFITTTFDSLLETAINEERFGGVDRTETIAYAPNDPKDLPGDTDWHDRTTVFHLFGRLSPAHNFVVTEEDTLEFLWSMQRGEKQPERLFDELDRNHLLIIGCSFPDWLTRFFLRIPKRRRLMDLRDQMEVLADSVARGEKNLAFFLDTFSQNTKVYPGTAVEFVSALAARWQSRGPDPDRDERAALEAMRPDSVFLSYASHDVLAVQRICGALDASGVDVWYDRDRLRGGDKWKQEIRRNIESCSFFIPVISRNAERRTEGVFIEEWRSAEERARRMKDGVEFILPVVIDDTPPYSAAIGAFADVQWTRLPDGKPSPDWVRRIVDLVRAKRRGETPYRARRGEEVAYR